MGNIDIENRIKFYKRITSEYNLVSPYQAIVDYTGNFPPENIRKYWELFLAGGKHPFLSLYVHIPFCRIQKCKFCMYNQKIVECDRDLDGYLDYISEVADFFGPVFDGRRFSTLFIGGGTPTLLDNEQLRRLFDTITNRFSFNRKGTHSIEVSPSHVTESQLDIAHEYGINRINIGVQSTKRETLDLAGREFAEIERVKSLVSYMEESGFEEINIDLIGGLPGDGIEGICDSFKMAAELGVTAITVYFFRPENSRYSDEIKQSYREYSKSNYKLATMEAISPLAEQYGYGNLVNDPDVICQKFINNDYSPKLVSYPTEWDSRYANSCLGIGAGARSFILDRMSFRDIGPEGRGRTDIAKALSTTMDFQRTKYIAIGYNDMDRMRDYVLKELYKFGRIQIDEFAKLFGKDIREDFGEEIRILEELGRMETREDMLTILCVGFEKAVYMKFFYDLKDLERLSKTKQPDC